MMHRIKKFARTCLAIVALISSAQVLAETDRVVYVNGIMTASIDADNTARKIQSILDDSVNHTSTKKTFIVTKSYNPMGWSTAGDGCLGGTGLVPAANSQYCLYQDNVELAMLKTAEERYLSSLQQLAMPHDAPKPLDVASATTIAQYADLMYGATADNTGLVKYGVADSSGMYAAQLAISGLSYAIQPTSVQPDGSIASGPVIVVAHSQGNLLANIAYAKSAIDYPQDNLGADISKRVRIVNLGNTSQVSMHNLSLTNSGDGALFGADEDYGLGLYNLAQTYDGVECLEEGPLCNILTSKNTWYRTTPSCDNGACQFTLDAPTFGFPNGASGKSIANHLVDTMYLSDNTVDPIDARGVNYTPGVNRFRDRFEDLVYTAMDSLSDAQQGWSTILRENFNEATTNAPAGWNTCQGCITHAVNGSLSLVFGYADPGSGPSTLLVPFDPLTTQGSSAVRIRTRFFVQPSPSSESTSSVNLDFGITNSLQFVAAGNDSMSDWAGMIGTFDQQYNFSSLSYGGNPLLYSTVFAGWVNMEVQIISGKATVNFSRQDGTTTASLIVYGSTISPHLSHAPSWAFSLPGGGYVLVDYVIIDKK